MIASKEKFKGLRYSPLALRKRRKGKCTMLPLTVGALGMVSEDLEGVRNLWNSICYRMCAAFCRANFGNHFEKSVENVVYKGL